jgi:Transposase DDE domain
MREAALGRFGDKRLAEVGTALLAAMQQQRTMCVHRLAKDRNQAIQFGRFLANPEVTATEMLATAGRLTGERAAGRHVLAIEDTTELHFPTHAASKRGFGKGGNGTDLGLFLHAVLAVDAENAGIVGLVDCLVMNRTGGKVSDRHQRETDDKESRRWLHGAEIAAERLAEAARITVVADRESDVYDLFARRPPGVDLLCRSGQDRALSDGGLLSARVSSWQEQDRYEIIVPARVRRAERKAAAALRLSRPERQATVALRFGTVALKRPAFSQDAAASVTLSVVDVQEIDRPAEQEPVRWRLLTTHPAASLDEARQIVAWYRMRWLIEQVFRALKSHGLRIEESQMQEAGGFVKLAAVALIAAVRSMQLVLARSGGTGQKLTDAAHPADLPALHQLSADLQGRTEKLKNPHHPATLAWLAWIVARLGGWSGYTSRGYKPPGPKTMHHGLLRLDGILAGWRLARRSGYV